MEYDPTDGGIGMERLTERFENGQVGVAGCGKNCKHDHKFCENAREDCPTFDDIYEKLATYEDAEEQGLPIRWIPCSERLPETSGYYLACVYDSDVDDFDFRKNWFAHKDDYDMDESEWRELQPFEVVTGWMPLPKPYRESEG